MCCLPFSEFSDLNKETSEFKCLNYVQLYFNIFLSELSLTEIGEHEKNGLYQAHCQIILEHGCPCVILKLNFFRDIKCYFRILNMLFINSLCLETYD